MFVDGVYLSRPGVALGELLDVQQIEVLRGPQGTLFGRNVSAGALNVTTRAPDLSEMEGFGTMTYGNFGLTSVQAGISLPIVEDQLAIRLSGAGRIRDALVQSTTGAESNTRDRWSLRAQALWQPTENLSIRVIGDLQEAAEECCDAPITYESPIVGLGLFAATGLPANGGLSVVGPNALEDRISNGSQFENPFEQDGVSAQVDWDLGFADLTYIGAHRNFRASSVQDSDFTSLDVFTVGGEGAPAGVPETYDDITSTSHEIRLAGTAGRLDWLVGAYFSNEDILEQQALSLGADFQQYISATLIALGSGADGCANIPDPGDPPCNPALFYADGVSADGDYTVNIFTQESESWSVFTHNTFRITDQLSATLGLRYVEETKDGAFEQIFASGVLPADNACLSTAANGANIPDTVIPNTGGLTLENFAVLLACFPFSAPALGGALPTEFSDRFEDEELLYTANLAYAFTPDISGYVSFTHGFKSGGFNLDPTAAIGGGDPRFASEIVDAWEIGLKSLLWDGRVRANLAIFQNEIEDFQVLEFTGVRFVTFNVAAVEVLGFELETQAQVTDQLSANFALTYSDAAYADDCAGGSTNPQVVALCGQPLTNAPEWVALGGLTYETEFGNNMRFFATGTARWEDDRRTSTQAVVPGTTTPSVQDWQEANTKLNLRFGIGSADEAWTLEVWGVNVTDEQTKNVTFNVPLRGSGVSAARGVFIEEPATYGATLRARF